MHAAAATTQATPASMSGVYPNPAKAPVESWTSSAGNIVFLVAVVVVAVIVVVFIVTGIRMRRDKVCILVLVRVNGELESVSSVCHEWRVRACEVTALVRFIFFQQRRSEWLWLQRPLPDTRFRHCACSGSSREVKCAVNVSW
jgi:hypothetical protein